MNFFSIYCYILFFLLVAVSAKAQSISAGEEQGLIICADSTVKSWGDNEHGQLGDGTMNYRNAPVNVISLTNVIAVTGGGDQSLALKNDGTVWAWGYNNVGQLGDGTSDDKDIPVLVDSLTGIIAIAAGESHSLALKKDGTVWAWGSDTYGELGRTLSGPSYIPVQVDTTLGSPFLSAKGVGNITAIAAGSYFSLALKNDSTVWGWGVNNFGELGSGDNINYVLPVQVYNLTSVIAIATGYYHSLALKNDGTVWAWGGE